MQLFTPTKISKTEAGPSTPYVDKSNAMQVRWQGIEAGQALGRKHKNKKMFSGGYSLSCKGFSYLTAN
jgi:hypothetical protein